MIFNIRIRFNFNYKAFAIQMKNFCLFIYFKFLKIEHFYNLRARNRVRIRVRNFALALFLTLILYSGPESNRHGLLAHRILSPACLPVPPPKHSLHNRANKNIHRTKKSLLKRGFRAKDRSRTGDLNLGKVTLYQLSYFRLFLFNTKNNYLICQKTDLFFKGYKSSFPIAICKISFEINLVPVNYPKTLFNSTLHSFFNKMKNSTTQLAKQFSLSTDHLLNFIQLHQGLNRC